MSNFPSDKLLAFAVRSVAANWIGVVGRDGRHRVTLEHMEADVQLVRLLRDLIGDIPQHAPKCAARVSPLGLCDCLVMERVRQIEAGVFHDSETEAA